MSAIHSELEKGRWFEMTLLEQLGNVGSEIGRAAKWKNKNQKIYEGAVFRALDLMQLTIADSKHRNRLHELTRANEMIGAAFYEEKSANETFEKLEKYFNQFAVAAQMQKGK